MWQVFSNTITTLLEFFVTRNAPPSQLMQCANALRGVNNREEAYRTFYDLIATMTIDLQEALAAAVLTNVQSPHTSFSMRQNPSVHASAVVYPTSIKRNIDGKIEIYIALVRGPKKGNITHNYYKSLGGYSENAGPNKQVFDVSIADTVIREVKEEAGFKLEESDLKFYHTARVHRRDNSSTILITPSALFLPELTENGDLDDDEHNIHFQNYAAPGDDDAADGIELVPLSAIITGEKRVKYYCKSNDERWKIPAGISELAQEAIRDTIAYHLFGDSNFPLDFMLNRYGIKQPADYLSPAATELYHQLENMPSSLSTTTSPRSLLLNPQLKTKSLSPSERAA